MPDIAPIPDGEIIALDTTPDRFGRWRLVAQVASGGRVFPMHLMAPADGDRGTVYAVPAEGFELVAPDAGTPGREEELGQGTHEAPEPGPITSEGVPKRR